MAWMLKGWEVQDNPRLCLISLGTSKGLQSMPSNYFTQAPGYEVGTFTSPYIVDFKERISLNGQMISEEDLLDLVNRVKPVD